METTNRTFELALSPCDLALPRVLGVCSRRRLEIRGLEYRREDGRLRLDVAGPPAQLTGAALWLGALVDVRKVAAT
jgi:hypothetical protein